MHSEPTKTICESLVSANARPLPSFRPHEKHFDVILISRMFSSLSVYDLTSMGLVYPKRVGLSSPKLNIFWHGKFVAYLVSFPHG